jgi:hypothetical protein
MYIRAKGMPTNPATARQSLVRSNFASLINRWTSDLTTAQRLAWTVYGDTTPYTDKLGAALVLTGQQEYLRTNALVRQSAGAAIDTAPTIFDRGEAINDVTLFGVTAGINLLATFTFGSPTSAAGQAMLYVGAAQNESKNYYNGPYQFGAVQAFAAAAGDVDFDVTDMTDPDDWAADHIPVAGQFVPIQVRCYFNDGRVPVRYRSIVEVSVTV